MFFADDVKFGNLKQEFLQANLCNIAGFLIHNVLVKIGSSFIDIWSKS